MPVTNNFDSPYRRDTKALHGTSRLRFPAERYVDGQTGAATDEGSLRRQAFILPQNLGRIHQDQTI